jgi:hypothetical protein
MSKLDKKAFEPIDQEESDLMKSLERDEWRPVKDFKQQKKLRLKQPETLLKKISALICVYLKRIITKSRSRPSRRVFHIKR